MRWKFSAAAETALAIYSMYYVRCERLRVETQETRRGTYVGTRLNRCPTTICTTRGMACKTDSQELAARQNRFPRN